MSTKPILYKGDMIRAILAGRKTQTRRLVKPQPIDDTANSGCVFSGDHMNSYRNDCHHVPWQSRFVELATYQVGDILWCRETWSDGYPGTADPYLYRATYAGGAIHKWRPSIFMPYDACRLFLRVTQVRVEQLQDISEDDAIAEGIARTDVVGLASKQTYKRYQRYDKPYDIDHPQHQWTVGPIHSYCTLWEKINGAGSWGDNPFVWVYTFEVTEKPATR